MARKALCVGIDDYPGIAGDLRGCANDARAWAALLTDHFAFAAPDVRLLLNGDATRAALLNGLDQLLAGSRPGDVLVFTHSSHGTYVPDRDGAEPTYDEALCPYDYRSNLIIHDELRERFASVSDGVQLVSISDSCHAGRVSRFSPQAASYRRARFLAPEEWGGRSFEEVARVRSRREREPDCGTQAIVLTGCQPHQYTFDARFGDLHHGAMTYHALRAIRENGYDLSYADLHARLRELLADAGFAQDPELAGRDDATKRRVFS